MTHYKLIIALSLSLMCFITACKKDTWLDAKPNKALVVPTSIADYQALLDNTRTMNTQMPGLSMVGDGDFYVTNDVYNGISSPQEKGAYLWLPTENFYGGQRATDWTTAFQRILQTNVVLDGAKTLIASNSNQSALNNIIGSALFFRSFDFYNLSQQYCKPYYIGSSDNDLGLPLRTTSNVNLQIPRSTLEQTYNQVINDLLRSASLLPVKPVYPTRPSKPAAYGLLARVFLSQQNYVKAFSYADSCLQLQNSLMDFNQLTVGSYDPGIPQFNKEVIFWTQLSMYSTTDNYTYIADPSLVQSFASNDLRNSIFFFDYSGHKAFWGTYIGDGYNNFCGIATDEMYLIRAECYARTGKIQEAMSDLNTLLKTRWKTGTYTNLAAANSDDALRLILGERRKELCFRNLRWSDLRRLNQDPRFQVTLTRTVNGQNYTLPPNSPRYVLPLDDFETSAGGLQQNTR